jgi:sensor c-di-GMP phosphodiesterase-like protein
MSKAWGMVSFILFCIGLVLSVIGGLVIPENFIVLMVLVIFGLIIGIIHVVYAKEVHTLHTLLLATIALLAMTAAFAPIVTLGIGKLATGILVNFAALMAPVALIAAIKALLTIGLEK